MVNILGQRKGTSVMAASTPMDENNPGMRIFRETQQHPDMHYMQCVDMSLMCKQCMLDKRPKCVHRPYTPSHLPPYRRKRAMIQTTAVADESTAAREVLGVIQENSTRIFPEKDIAKFIGNIYQPGSSSYLPPNDVHRMHIYVDPNMGGACNFALVGCFIVNGCARVRSLSLFFSLSLLL
jgi:hypothetical protein